MAPLDAARLGLELAHLDEGTPSTGVGGRMETRTTPATLTMDSISIELTQTLLAPPPVLRRLPIPSLLGRDVHQAQIFDAGDWFNSALLPGSATNLSHVNDPKVNELAAKQRAELDPQKRLDIVHELVQYLAGQVYHLVMPQSFITQTWQPFVRGYSPRPGFQPSFAATWLDR